MQVEAGTVEHVKSPLCRASAAGQDASSKMNDLGIISGPQLLPGIRIELVTRNTRVDGPGISRTCSTHGRSQLLPLSSNR